MIKRNNHDQKPEIRKQYPKPKNKRSINLYFQFKLNKCKLKKHNERGWGETFVNNYQYLIMIKYKI